MDQLNINEISMVSGGAKSSYDAVDIVSTLTGSQMFNNAAIVVLAAVGYKPYSSLWLIFPQTTAYAFGGYVGYQIGQYIKGDE